MAATLQTIDDLRGPAGKLEALLNVGRTDSTYAAVVCHPHPPSGGTMHTRAVYQAMKALTHFGVPVLRFNFRGVGLSAGTYDDGPGEIEDTRAAMDWVSANLNLPLLVGGFSFGANISFRTACGDVRVKGLFGLGMPAEAHRTIYKYDFLATCTQPKLFITGAEDPFAPRAAMERIFRDAPEPKQMEWIAGAEHFFMGVPGSPEPKLDRMQLAMRQWLGAHFFPDQTA